MTATRKQVLARKRNWAILRLRGSISSLYIDPAILKGNAHEINHHLDQAAQSLLKAIAVIKNPGEIS